MNFSGRIYDCLSASAPNAQTCVDCERPTNFTRFLLSISLENCCFMIGDPPVLARQIAQNERAD